MRPIQDQTFSDAIREQSDDGAQHEQEEDYSEEEVDMSDDEASDVEDSVKEDIEKFEQSFKGIGERFRLINRIGEGKVRSLSVVKQAHQLYVRRFLGTFSTVYKAEDLLYDYYWNDWDQDSTDSQHWLSPPIKKNKNYPSPAPHKRARYVAVKKIYVTSSPSRIQNELELLNDLRCCKAVCPLITAFRHEDQVVAVLPFYRHQDFRACASHKYI